MAKITRSIVISGLSGSLGMWLYVRQTWDDNTIINVKRVFSNRRFSKE